MIDLNTDITQIQAPTPHRLTKSELSQLKLVEVGKIPNQRRLIIPDPGMTMIDMDLDRADAQFVAWEANDRALKDILKAGEDLHLQNAKDIWGSHVKKKGPERQLAKRFCHAVNYGAYPKKLARALGIDLKLADWIYGRWFFLHPGIRAWHNRTRDNLARTRTVYNPFGFRRYFFDRPENCLNEALAWSPQSAVGIIINTAWANIDDNVKDVEVLMQVHDSLTMQAPSKLVHSLLPDIQRQSLITVPYDDPLIIPVGFKLSEESWGDAEPPCCDSIMKPPQAFRRFLDDKGKEREEGCKDHKLHLLLMRVLEDAKSQTATQLA